MTAIHFDKMKLSVSTVTAIVATISSTINISFASPLTLQSRDHSPSPRLSTVFQFSTVGTWLENLAIRFNGNILATRADVPELWSIDPSTGHGVLAASAFGSAKSLVGITEIDHDVFAVVAGQLDLAKFAVTPGSWGIWKVDYSKRESTPDVSLIKAVPESQFFNGITTFSQDTILIADCFQGVIYKLNWKTGAYSIALSDATMKIAAGGRVPIGVNGVKVRDNYVYFTSTSQGILVRVQVDRSAEATGPYEIIASGFIPDDFVLSPRKGTPFIAANDDEKVIAVKNGQPVTVAGSNTSLAVAGCTALQFGRGREDEGALYVTTSGALAAPVNGTVKEPAKVVRLQVW